MAKSTWAPREIVHISVALRDGGTFPLFCMPTSQASLRADVEAQINEWLEWTDMGCTQADVVSWVAHVERRFVVADSEDDDDEPVECVYCTPNRTRPPISLRELIEKAKAEDWPADYVEHFDTHLTGE